MAERRMTAARVMEIMDRQFPERWGPDYIPGQLATRGEAPSSSRPQVFRSALLQRDVHAMSKVEMTCFALALYHPNVFEFKEQHALASAPHTHPLQGHPRAKGMCLPMTSGAPSAAERLGLSKTLGLVLDEYQIKDQTHYRWLPNVIVRDLLLFVHDKQGPYCVCWDVKANQGDHGLPGPGTWDVRTSPRRKSNVKALDAIYVEYMRELGIPVVRVASGDLNRMLATNLRRLLLSHAKPIELSAQMHVALVDALAEALERGWPPSRVIRDFMSCGVPSHQAVNVLYQAIWNRRIRVDLYSYMSIDRPLVPEVRDPLDEFAHWFQRAV